MNIFEKFILSLQTTMEEPVAFGWFHLLCLSLTLLMILVLFLIRKKYNEKQLKKVLLIYGLIVLILEILKQISWSFNYDQMTNIITWDYQWYAFPFQLCTMPIYISLICVFLKKGKLRDSLLSFVAFYTILGSISTMLLPNSCFTKDILVNIHTMFLHCGSFVVSIYLLMTKEVEIKFKNFKNAFIVFLICVFIANTLNLIFYNTNIIDSETFNMFFISPYFISTLPIFNLIQTSVPYLIFLFIYLIVITLGSIIIYEVSKIIEKLLKKNIENNVD